MIISWIFRRSWHVKSGYKCYTLCNLACFGILFSERRASVQVLFFFFIRYKHAGTSPTSYSTKLPLHDCCHPACLFPLMEELLAMILSDENDIKRQNQGFGINGRHGQAPQRSSWRSLLPRTWIEIHVSWPWLICLTPRTSLVIRLEELEQTQGNKWAW